MNTARHLRRSWLLPLLVLWLLASGPGGAPAADPPAAAPGKAIAAKGDSATPAGPEFIPLARRPLPTGLFVSALVAAPGRLWAVGDSGLIAWSADDSLFRRLEAPDALPLHCAALVEGRLACAGDSGRVYLVAEGRARRAALPDRRTVRDLSFLGATGLLGGDAGLLARSMDGGRSWDTLAAPLPMRFNSVLVHGQGWWVGGAGGRLFHSLDAGLHWQPRERLSAAVTDLAPAGADRVAVLDRAGGLHLEGPGGRRSLGRAPLDQAHSLAAVQDGWAVVGDGGRVARLDTVSGTWRAGRLPLPAALPALAVRDSDLLLGGAWSTLARWRDGEEQPMVLRHTLTTAAAVELVAVAVEDQAADSVIVDAAAVAQGAGDGRRYFQNSLDTGTRCTTPATRLQQLERSYDNTRWLGLSGRAMLALDVGADGGLDSILVLDEWPAGLGVGDQARQLAAGLTFTPGFRGSSMVASRMIFPVVFPGSEADYLAWARGERAAGALLDSLVALLPRAASSLPPKALVKAMDFPRKARRYVWEGQAVVEYRLTAEGEVRQPRKLWESEAKYGFGDHAVAVLPKLRMALPAGVGLAPGDHLRVVQRLNFDRKRYGQAAREEAKGFRFAPVLVSLAESDTARYGPGLAQLEWLLNDFLGEESGGEWPELELNLVLRHDGRLHSFSATPATDGRPLDTAVLRSLAIQFTWGRPLARKAEQLDTLALRWQPARFSTDSLAAPSGLRALLQGVVY